MKIYKTGDMPRLPNVWYSNRLDHTDWHPGSSVVIELSKWFLSRESLELEIGE